MEKPKVDLSTIDTSKELCIKIADKDKQTKWIPIDRDSANTIIVWLQNNFVLKNKY